MAEIGAHVVAARVRDLAHHHLAAHHHHRKPAQDAPGRPEDAAVAPEATQPPKGAQRGR